MIDFDPCPYCGKSGHQKLLYKGKGVYLCPDWPHDGIGEYVFDRESVMKSRARAVTLISMAKLINEIEEGHSRNDDYEAFADAVTWSE